MTDPLKQIEQVREARYRSTARSTLLIAFVLSLVFLVRAVEWQLVGRIISLSSCAALTALSLLILHRGGSRSLAAQTGMLGCTIAIGYSVFSSGGLSHPATGWLIILPLVGSLVAGRHGVLLGLGFSTLSAAGLYFFDLSYGFPPDVTPEDFREAQARLAQVAQLVFVALSVHALFRQIEVSEDELANSVLKLTREVEARSKAEAEAEKANRIKSEFLANMSHEIRTPMNGVLGVLDLLNEQPLDEKARKYVELGKSSSNTLMVIINDILDLSKIESGKLSLEQASFNLAELLEHLLKSMALKAEKKGLQFQRDVRLCCDYVTGDAVRIRQIIENLGDNAVKFTETGTVKVSISLTSDQDRLLLDCSVSDTGIGIPQKQLPELFTPFMQSETSTTRRFGGTGLGLSICKKLLEQMGGEIHVSSRIADERSDSEMPANSASSVSLPAPQTGSTFRFTLPLEAGQKQDPTQEDTQPHLTASAKPLQAETCRVLLVEDNDINIQIALAMLGAFPLEIDLAKNGQEAIERVQAATPPYAAILMDCQMPVMDGYEATRILRKNNALSEIPIIAMTANAMRGDEEKCLEAGMSDYISKPISQHTLAQKLTKWGLLR